jgi:hypothetical protein
MQKLKRYRDSDSLFLFSYIIIINIFRKLKAKKHYVKEKLKNDNDMYAKIPIPFQHVHFQAAHEVPISSSQLDHFQ